jgi:Flp pilus assembly protein protease CpaA
MTLTIERQVLQSFLGGIFLVVMIGLVSVWLQVQANREQPARLHHHRGYRLSAALSRGAAGHRIKSGVSGRAPVGRPGQYSRA